MKTLRAISLVVAVLITSSLNVDAATLFGKVIEVIDGDVIRVFNLNRPVRVRLIGIDAPEATQAFGDIAKQHLADLLLNKNVVVEYSGLGHDGAIVGRVLLNDVDMNAQMIRDGAAWYDPAYKTQLAETQREIYSQSELAARSEKRGLWQTDGAVAPWEFVKNESNRSAAIAGLVRSTNSERANRPTPELTSESLFSARSTGRGSGTPSDTSWATTSSARKNWQKFQPEGENFSAEVPEGGKLTKEAVPFGNQTIDVNYYMTRDGASIFALMWTNGPSTGESDAVVIKSALAGFLRGVGAGYESVGGHFSCEPSDESDISAAGYTGKVFNLQGCTIPGMARVFTKASGSKRHLYLGAVFYGRDDANVQKFINSFSINQSAGVAAKTTKRGVN